MAAKLKDGLFIGDSDTSQDPEFLELNKINSLINLAGREIPNVWAAHGGNNFAKYLNLIFSLDRFSLYHI